METVQIINVEKFIWLMKNSYPINSKTIDKIFSVDYYNSTFKYRNDDFNSICQNIVKYFDQLKLKLKYDHLFQSIFHGKLIYVQWFIENMFDVNDELLSFAKKLDQKSIYEYLLKMI